MILHPIFRINRLGHKESESELISLKKGWATAARAAPVTEVHQHKVERCESLSVRVKSGTAPKRSVSTVRKVRGGSAGGEEPATKPRASTHHILLREKQGGDVSGTDWSEDLPDRSGREWRRAWPSVRKGSDGCCADVYS